MTGMGRGNVFPPLHEKDARGKADVFFIKERSEEKNCLPADRAAGKLPGGLTISSLRSYSITPAVNKSFM